jgi:integrase
MSATFADAAAGWLRYIEHDRGRKPSTVAGYRVIVRSQLLPAFGELPLESITTESIERWIGERGGGVESDEGAGFASRDLPARSEGLGAARESRRRRREARSQPQRDIQVFSPEEVWALVRAAAVEQDGAIFLTAAFTGLRIGELLALR